MYLPESPFFKKSLAGASEGSELPQIFWEIILIPKLNAKSIIDPDNAFKSNSQALIRKHNHHEDTYMYNRKRCNLPLDKVW